MDSTASELRTQAAGLTDLVGAFRLTATVALAPEFEQPNAVLPTRV